jgi:hypothetical protein
VVWRVLETQELKHYLQRGRDYTSKIIFSLKVLVSVPSKQNLRLGFRVQGVYSGSNPRKQAWGWEEKEKEEKSPQESYSKP